MLNIEYSIKLKRETAVVNYSKRKRTNSISCTFRKATWSTAWIIYRWIRHCAEIVAAFSLFVSLSHCGFYSYFIPLSHRSAGSSFCYLSSADSKSHGTRLSLWVWGCKIFTLSPGHQNSIVCFQMFRSDSQAGSRVNAKGRGHARPLLIGSWIDLCNFDWSAAPIMD